MPLIRNPFSRKTAEPTPPAPAAAAPAATETSSTGASIPPATSSEVSSQATDIESQQSPANGHDVETQASSQASSSAAKSSSSTKPVTIVKTSGKDEPDVYKLGVVTDGVYLPPSPPTEKRGSKVWSRSKSSNSVKPRDATVEGEPFTISRESFDSYRRSFDISARLPIPETKERRSLDVRLRNPSTFSTHTPPRTARASESNMRPTVESIFEEVSLSDDHPRPRRGLLSKLVGHGSVSEAEHSQPPQQKQHNTLGARLRGMGFAQGEAELLRIDREREKAALAAAGKNEGVGAQ